MPATRKIPYPPNPPAVPDGLTDFPLSYIQQQNRLLAGLLVFLILYIAMVLFFAMVGVWCVLTLSAWFLFKVAGIVLCGIFFVFLVKGFFKRNPVDKDMSVELIEDEHPVLFGFIYKLCDEIGAPYPNKVYATPDVNAACAPRLSLINLFVQPKNDLLIGLGLVNAMNLSEFKAVLAHEFGHFCQSGQAWGYSYVVRRIIVDMVRGEDWFDRFIDWCRKKPKYGYKPNDIRKGLYFFAAAIGLVLDGWKAVLFWLLKLFVLQDRTLSREQEFHADKVAVSAAGSDAATHMLLRVRFGMECFLQALDDLVVPARDNKQYSTDLYLHQDRAADVVRRNKKDDRRGLPPDLPTPMAGKTIKVFDAEQDELEDEDTTPPMWRTHPVDADREENAKEPFVVAETDHRSPWVLFDNAAELKERLTYKFCRRVFGMRRDADLTDAQEIQEFIDNEHAECTYDPKYQGVYDNRKIEPGDLVELDNQVQSSPWTEERMRKVYDKLYTGVRERAEEFADLHKELQSRRSSVRGRPSAKIKKMIEEIRKQMDEKWEWFASFDRRAYLLHIQMAAAEPDLKTELVERYRFQLEVQRLYTEALVNFENADDVLRWLNSLPPHRIRNDTIAEVIAELRKAWKGLKRIVAAAREINLPAMKNFEEGDRLADFILDGKMVPEPPIGGPIKDVWLDKLFKQLQGVRTRCARLHFKSLGGILALKERIAAKWLAAGGVVAGTAVGEPIVEAVPVEAAEVVETEVLPAVVIGEVVDAEVLPLAEAGVLAPPAGSVVPADAVPAPAVLAPAETSLAALVAQPALTPSGLTVQPVPPTGPEPAVGLASEPSLAAIIAESLAAAPPPALALPPEPVLEPASASPPDEVAAEPVAHVFALDAVASPPVPAEEVFSLNADAPSARASAIPPPPGAEVISLDAEESMPARRSKPARPAPAKAELDPEPLPEPEPLPAEEVFSLDADEMPAKPAKPGAKVAAEPLPLDDEPMEAEVMEAEVMEAEVMEAEVMEAEVMEAEVMEAEVMEAEVMEAEPVEIMDVVDIIEEDDEAPPIALPSKPVPAPALSGAVDQPAARAAMPPAVAAASAPEASVPGESGTTVNTRRNRPPVKITFVKPGQKSPFAK